MAVYCRYTPRKRIAPAVRSEKMNESKAASFARSSFAASKVLSRRPTAVAKAARTSPKDVFQAAICFRYSSSILWSFFQA
jgi:hypothetical protein